MPPSRALLVFSHLRWDFVYQRPQHLLSRLARDFRVIYVEEPEHAGNEPRLEVNETREGVTVCRPRIPNRGVASTTTTFRSCNRWWRTIWSRRASTTTRSGSTRRWPCRWSTRLQPRARLRLHGRARRPSWSRRAQLLEREARAARARRPGVHRRPEPVPRQERPPPERALLPEQRGRGALRAAASRAVERGGPGALPHPRLGFFGVIDERLDLALLAAVAGRPPGVAVRDGRPGGEDRPGSAAAPPEHPLPRPAAATTSCRPSWPGWDVCLLPFARTRRRASSARPRRSSTWRPASRSSARRSPTWPSRTATSSIWPTRPTEFVAACERALRELGASAQRRQRAHARRARADLLGQRPPRRWRS